ncbi:hypothetical protein BFJ68_g4072 [Fusarium oxysporum]|uniref:Uncharacterized protein n=1 Tax=Fusarium oxysporum TaxID=5507 RepID=A0A420RN00_FUSOX|nr:hypothetical protein BFJ68_g4072 [Fusarium oxysporum]
MGLVHHGLDLFNYDQKTCSNQVLITAKDTPSNIEYDEFRKPDDDEAPLAGMEGRIRRVICFKRKTIYDGGRDILSMTVDDLAAMNLHPATLQYSTRTTTESRFWSKDKSQLKMPKTPCDFLSMTYDVRERSATILVRQSWEPRRHNLDDLDEYDHRLESCRNHWAHPLIMPVVLLQVQFMRCEEAVIENNSNVAHLEYDVSNIAGFDATETGRRLSRTFSNGKDGERIAWGPSTMTKLMKRAHEVLKDTIKLLDTIRWMERAIKVLILAGDELNERMGNYSNFGNDLSMLSPTVIDPLGGPPAVSPVLPPRDLPRLRFPDEVTDGDSLGPHWHEIRQYLDGLLRLCMGLETDRRMSEARCRAQIDMMAQEDNILNARMAVASSRDSSSMKALAVITAIFLPGEFLGTLFGMSMFDWLGPDEEDNDSSGPMTDQVKVNRFGENFWYYWATVIPLTLLILFVWRAWWVTQDRYFRRHLSQELSEERFWTADGKPRKLERSFIWDFFYLSARRDEKPRPEDDLAELETVHSGAKEGYDGGLTGATNMRQRQILETRKWSLHQRGTNVTV